MIKIIKIKNVNYYKLLKTFDNRIRVEIEF